jgi:hypothetical protein
MTQNPDIQSQLTEIQERISESRVQWSGGGLIGGVWAGLTLLVLFMSIVFRPPGNVQTWLWLAHNALGWIFTFTWWEYESRKAGRRSLRGQFTLRLWAALTLAIWLCIFAVSGSTRLLPEVLPFFFVSILLGIGCFGTGLLSESRLSQALGVLWLVYTGMCAFLTAPPVTLIMLIAGLVVALLTWVLGGWYATRRR